MRLVYLLAYLAFIAREVVKGSWNVTRDALTPGLHSTPAIVELPLRCRTDLEVTAMASSITITPGTIVVGTAAGDGVAAPVLFVHSLYADGRQEILAGLHDMESRLLRVTRGRSADEPDGRDGLGGRDGPDGRPATGGRS